MTPSPYEYIPPEHEGGYSPRDPYAYQESYDRGFQEGRNARPVGPSDDERTWATVAHLAGPVAMILSVGWAGFLGPFLIWLAYKGRSPFVRNAAAQSFNFNVILWAAILIGRVFRLSLIHI